MLPTSQCSNLSSNAVPPSHHRTTQLLWSGRANVNSSMSASGQQRAVKCALMSKMGQGQHLISASQHSKDTVFRANPKLCEPRSSRNILTIIGGDQVIRRGAWGDVA